MSIENRQSLDSYLSFRNHLSVIGFFGSIEESIRIAVRWRPDHSRYNRRNSILPTPIAMPPTPPYTHLIRMGRSHSIVLFILCCLGDSTLFAQQAPIGVVINEVHHDASPKTQRAEFVELYNSDDTNADLSGWQLEGVGGFTFPPGTVLAPKRFLVIAENIATMRSKFRVRTSFQYPGGLENDGELLLLLDRNGVEIDRVDYKSGFPWPTAARGSGASMELIHPTLDNDLGASWRSSTSPTPAATNSVFANNAPPQARQVKHTPPIPQAAEDVLITVKVTDPDGVASVTLSYQLVDPGAYIRKSAPEYDASWSQIPMHDNGALSDKLANDSIYSVTMPVEMQRHRRLVRYRITVEDALGNAVRVPYADDDSPNFAYFTYDGVPAWSGAKQRARASQSFPAELMGDSIPVYHLIGNSRDVTNSQYTRSSDGVSMWGTLVYEGIVYDHIQYHNRGEASTYVSGKNKWRFKFNRARDFESRGNHGKRYKANWKTLNLNACASPWLASNRGIAGLDEAVPHRLYQLADVPSSNTHWIHFRVVDSISEAPPNQYAGDLWGLYLAIEHPDERFLAERNLPDRSTYKIERNSGDKKNQGPDQSLDSSDWDSFWSDSSRRNTVDWWRAHLDLQTYYGFRAINRAIGNVDLRDGANYYMYQRPEGQWAPIPWDLDMMYAPVKHIWSGVIRAERCLVHSEIRIEFKNRCRGLLDLLFSDSDRHGGQAAQVVHELSQIVNPSHFPLTMVDVDEYMWSYNSRTSESHRGPWYQLSVNETRLANNYRRTIPTADHEGFQQSIIDYMYNTRTTGRFRVDDAIEDGYGFGYLAQEAADTRIPDQPTIFFNGAADFAIDHLLFTSSPYSSPRDTTGFASMHWRVGEVANPVKPGFKAGDPWVYEIEKKWDSGPITPFKDEIEIPAIALLPSHTYRARVRHFNRSGRASHWSEPIEFVAGEPNVTPYRDSLVISEIMYRPIDEPRAEFIELYNTGSDPIDLTGVRFTKGIDFDFPAGATIDPGKYSLVIGDKVAFEKKYGPGLPVVGVWDDGDRLSNNGEQLKLSFGSGVTIHELEYTTTSPWPEEPAMNGHSLTFKNAESGLGQDDPTNWLSSITVGGTPGKGDRVSLEDWMSANGLSAGQELSDHDQDGLPALVEYGVGGNPRVADADLAMKLVFIRDQAHFVFTQARNTIGVRLFAEFSPDLDLWQPTELVSIQRNEFDTVTVRPADQNQSGATGFFRLQGSRIRQIGRLSNSR